MTITHADHLRGTEPEATLRAFLVPATLVVYAEDAADALERVGADIDYLCGLDCPTVAAIFPSADELHRITAEED